LLRFWIGQNEDSITSGYSMIKNDAAFRKAEAEKLGLGLNFR
jgi:hypothetical protein